MGLKKFTPEDDIFVDEEVLRDNHTPDELLEREEQLDEYQNALKPVVKGTRPKNIFLVGQTGVGKTVATDLIRQRMEIDQEDLHNVDVEFVYLNCKKLTSSYAVAANLVNCFRSDDDQITTTGYPPDMVYNMLYKEFIELDATHVLVVLDEVDAIGDDDNILYELPRANDHGEVPPEETYVGVIGISNDFTFRDGLSAQVKDSLAEEEIHFPPYDANQLGTILEHRAENAFVDGVLEDDVIPLCAAFAAQEHGDARRALDLLRTAGELAERDRTDVVNEAHVRKAQEKIELDRVVEVVRTLPTQSKLVLYAIILLEGSGVHNINTGEVFNIYKRLCQEIDADVLTQRRVTDLISELDMLGIVNAVVVSKGRYGRTKEISLSVPIDETEAVLLSDSRIGEVEETQPFVQARFDN